MQASACGERNVLKSIRTLVTGTLLSTVALNASAIVPVTPPPTTTTSPPPDCRGAAASLGVIWPPDHDMVAITIVGLGTEASVAITGIQQDEPVNVNGSGNTAPDGDGIGTSTALVRAERAGPGTGRIYFISFTATNSAGECSGTVQASVPHDQGQGFTPVDTGLRFDSTLVPG